MNFRRKLGLAFLNVTVTLLVTLASRATVRAADTLCTGSLGAITVENLIVPDNASCTLNGTIVIGNLTVKHNATLLAYAAQVGNDAKADGAARVSFYPGSSVGHDLHVSKSEAADIQSIDVKNNLVFNENSQAVSAAGSTIGKDFQATKNTGGVSINNNTIGGNLQCKDNNPPPSGSGNLVSGNMENQCANFGVVPAPTSTPVADTEAPSVEWTAPVPAGERYDLDEGQQVTLEATAWDNDRVSQVTFFRWDAVNLHYVTIRTLSQSPYQADVQADALNLGWNQVFVTATDAAGNQSDRSFIWLYKLPGGEMNYWIFLPVAGK